MAYAQPATTISIAHKEAEFGTTVNVPVTTTGIPSFVILQLSIAYNPEVMTFTGIANRHASLGGMNVGELDGVITFSFFTLNSRSIGAGQKLFDLMFDFCTDLSGCLAAGGGSALSFYGGAGRNYIQDALGLDFITYVTTTINGSVFSNNNFKYLIINASGSGEVFVNGNSYNEPLPFNQGDNPEILAVPATGWYLNTWGGDLTGTTNPQNMLMTSHKTVTVDFSINQYTLTLITNGSGNVLVNEIPYTEPITFNYGETPLLNAQPGTGWQFDNWSGDLSNANNPTTITMNGNKTVTANLLSVTHLDIVNETFTAGQNECRGAEQTITISQTSVESGAVLSLVAGENIIMLPGTHFHAGSSVNARISPGGPFCPEPDKHFLSTGESPDVSAVVVTVQDLPEDIGLKPLFKVFPNPTNGSFTIELDDEASEEGVLVEVYNLLGSRVISVQLSAENQHTLSLDGQQRGIYIIRVMQGDRIAVERLIKR